MHIYIYIYACVICVYESMLCYYVMQKNIKISETSLTASLNKSWRTTESKKKNDLNYFKTKVTKRL